MISHANLNSGQTSDYYQKDNYYKTQDDGRWAGRLAEEKGLRGAIRQPDFDALVRERGVREGYDLHLSHGSGAATEETRTAHAMAVAEVKAYLQNSGIAYAGALREENNERGTTIALVNKSELTPQGLRLFEPNDALSAHREKIEQVYREALNARTGRDTGSCEIRDRAVPQVAYDFTLSAPKSVSIAMAQGGQVEQDMRRCHLLAVERTQQYLEGYVEARRKHNEVVHRERTGNMVCGLFTHGVSRNLDPQLHTHLVIFNKTRCEDGKERAIDNHSLVTHKFHFDLVYKAELARALQERGYELKADHQKGTFELRDVNREHIEPFSTRHTEIQEKIEAWGKDPATANRDMRDAACQLTRDSKKNCDMAKLREAWQLTMRGLGTPAVRPQDGPVRPEKGLAEVFREAERALAAKSFAFQPKEFLDEALKRGLGRGVTLADAEKHLQGRLGEGGMFKLGPHNGKEYLCTQESWEIEQAVFRHVAAGQGQVAGLEPTEVERRLAQGVHSPEGKAIHLSAEQQAAVRHIAASGDRFSAVQGLAGTGKTTMLNQAREIYEAAGYQVKGVCFTGKAAESLVKEAGIDSATIHAILNALEKEAREARGEDFRPAPDLAERAHVGWNLDGLRPTGKEVWIVDEASMVDNRLMRQLQEAALAKDAKVVFTGDARQLQPIGAGNAFANMIERDKIAHVSMTDIKRQVDPTLPDRRDPRQEEFFLRQAVRGAVQDPTLDGAMEKLRPHIHQVEQRGERLAAVACEYASRDQADRRNTLIVTGTNADRQAINGLVRENLKKDGLLKPGVMVASSAGRREMAAGDTIVFLKNDKNLQVKNGTIAEVKAVSRDGAFVTVQAGSRRLQIDVERYNHFDHGYCLTAHKAQGVTYDKAIIQIDTSQRGVNNRNAFYVDVSRARHEVKIFTDSPTELSSAVGKWQHKLSSDDFRLDGATATTPAPGKDPCSPFLAFRGAAPADEIRFAPASFRMSEEPFREPAGVSREPVAPDNSIEMDL